MKPAPGSKKPESATDAPVTVTVNEALRGTKAGETLTGVAGAGGCSLTARTPQEFAASAYSWKVHIVMSSLGSTTTWE